MRKGRRVEEDVGGEERREKEMRLRKCGCEKKVTGSGNEVSDESDLVSQPFFNTLQILWQHSSTGSIFFSSPWATLIHRSPVQHSIRRGVLASASETRLETPFTVVMTEWFNLRRILLF